MLYYDVEEVHAHGPNLLVCIPSATGAVLPLLAPAAAGFALASYLSTCTAGTVDAWCPTNHPILTRVSVSYSAEALCMGRPRFRQHIEVNDAYARINAIAHPQPTQTRRSMPDTLLAASKQQ